MKHAAAFGLSGVAERVARHVGIIVVVFLGFLVLSILRSLVLADEQQDVSQ